MRGLTWLERLGIFLAGGGVVSNGMGWLQYEPRDPLRLEAAILCVAVAGWIFIASLWRRRAAEAIGVVLEAAESVKTASAAIRYLTGCGDQAADVLLGLKVTGGSAVNSTRPPMMERAIEN